MLEITPGSTWCYVGPGPGQGEIHRVLEVKYPNVITWGLGYKSEGHSFLGEPNLFLMWFKPA